MSERERLRREDPVRTAPIRNWSTLYRRSDSWDLCGPSEQPAPSAESDGHGSWNDIVSHGVDLGYRVIEEQIRLGQCVAEKLNSRSYDPGATGNDLRDIADRVWRYYADLGGLWIDFLNSLFGESDLLRRLFAAGQQRPEASNGTSANGATAVSIDVSCSRPARVTLDLRPDAAKAALVCQDLRALDAARPPLTDLRFTSTHDGSVHLHVRVPEGQPPGVYAGAVLDRDTGQPRGTLSVRLT